MVKRKLRLAGLLPVLLDSSPPIGGPTCHRNTGPPPPLAPQPPSTINIDAVKLIPPTKPHHWCRSDPNFNPNDDFTYVLAMLYDPRWIEERLPQTHPDDMPMIRSRSSLLAHIHQHASWDKLAECSQQDISAAMPWFTRLKSDGKSSRPLYDMTVMNHLLGKTKSPRLPTPAQVVDYAMKFNVAASIDLSGWYSQIPIGDKLSSICGVMAKDEVFRFITLPQGYNGAPLAGQILSTRLTTGIEHRVAGLIYDNFLVAGYDDEDLTRATSVFYDNCDKCNAVINTAKTTKGPTVDYCGMTVDVGSKTFSVTDEWAAKASKALTQALGLLKWSFKDAFAVFGVSEWFIRISRTPLCFARPILSAQRLIGRRIARGAAWTSSFEPSEVLRAFITTLRDRIRSNTKIPWHHPRTSVFAVTAFSDASDWGLGVVIVVNNTITAVVSEPWPDEATGHSAIHIREMIAFRRAREVCPEAHLYLVDNKIVTCCTEKGHSPRPDIDNHLRDILPSLHAHIAYVPTELNISDHPSRNRSLSFLKSFNLKPYREQLLAAVQPTLVDWTYAAHRD